MCNAFNDVLGEATTQAKSMAEGGVEITTPRMPVAGVVFPLLVVVVTEAAAAVEEEVDDEEDEEFAFSFAFFASFARLVFSRWASFAVSKCSGSKVNAVGLTSNKYGWEDATLLSILTTFAVAAAASFSPTTATVKRLFLPNSVAMCDISVAGCNNRRLVTGTLSCVILPTSLVNSRCNKFRRVGLDVSVVLWNNCKARLAIDGPNEICFWFATRT